MIYSEKLIEEVAKKYNLKANKAKALIIYVGSWEGIDRRLNESWIVEEIEGMAELNNLTMNDMLEIQKMIIAEKK